MCARSARELLFTNLLVENFSDCFDKVIAGMEGEDSSSDEEGFVPYVGGKRKKIDDAGADGLVKNLLQNNKFGPLAGDNNNGGSTGGGAPAVPPGQRKQPPIVVRNMRHQKLRVLMHTCSAKPVYKLVSYGVQIICSTPMEFEVVQKHLLEKEVEFYTYQKRSEQPHRVVLRGLPQMKPEKVKEWLRKLLKLDALEVYRITRRGESSTSQETPYIVLFPKGYTNLKKLSEINSLNRVSIRWEVYRNKKPNVTQCRNCLLLGHGTRNCHLKARCNKCGGAHKTEGCKPEETQAKRCANCSGAHEAMDRSCPKRAEFIRSRQQSSKPKPPKAEKGKPVPVFNLDEFPPLPGAVPGEPSPQPGGSNGGTGPGAGGTQKDPLPRGSKDSAGSRADAATKADEEEELYSAEELWKLFLEFSAMLKNCRTRSDQERVVAAMACRFNAN